MKTEEQEPKQSTDPIKGNRKKLYNALSKEFDLGDEANFNAKLDTPEGRRKLYDAANESYDLGAYEDYESRILKKKDSAVGGAEESSQQLEQQEEPTSKNGEAITDRLEISSKLPSSIPTVSSREQTLSKAEELSHDINSLKNSEMYKASMKTMKDLEESSNLLKSLEPTGGDKLDQTNEGEVNAYNVLVEQYNSKRNEHLEKEENSQEAITFLNTYDNHVKEYNTLLSKSKEGATKQATKKSDSIPEILGLAWDQTYLADLPASELNAKVARIRRRSNAIHVLKKNKEWASGKIKDIREVNIDREIIKGIENIDVKSAERLKDAVEKTTKEKTKLENDRTELKKIADAGGYKSIGDKQSIKMDVNKLYSEVDELTKKIDKLAITEKKQGDAWNVYMKPVLERTAEKAIPLAEEAQRLQEWGQKEFGSKLRLSVKDVDSFRTTLEYIAAQASKSAPYSIHGALTLGTGMIGIEQGSIEGDILSSLAKKEGISIAEVLKRGIDQEGAELAFNSGVEAGLWEFAGTGVTLIAPWLKLGLVAKTVIPKNAFVKLLKTSLNTLTKLTAAGTGEALTEMKQTDIELTAKYKALGYTDEEIRGLIGPEEYIESGVAGFAASFGISGPSTFISVATEEAQNNRLLVKEQKINADKANKQMLGNAYKAAQFESKTKEQVINEVRESVDRENPESIEEKVQEIEDKVNQEETLQGDQLETEVESPTESTKQKTDSELADSTLPIYKIGDKEYEVKVEDGNLSILDKEGNEPSKYGRKKITDEYEKTINYLGGEIAGTPKEDLNKEEAYEHVAKNSNNPAEVVEHYVYASNVEDIEGDYKLSQIAENIPAISREDFAKEYEEEITFGLARTYLKKRKDKFGKSQNTTDLDGAAQEISETAGLEIEPQDIVDFMIAYPNGYKEKAISESAKKLSNRFEDLTGLKLTPNTIERVAEQKAEQQGIENEKYNKLINQNYETELEAENAYYQQIAEEADKQSAKVSSIPESTKEVEAGAKLMQEGKDQVAKGLDMFSKASKPSSPLSSSFIGFTSEQVEAIQEIGSGLIKQGLATVQNVAQKVKDYFKEQGVILPDGLLEKVYPSIKKPLTDKTEAAQRKEDLEKDIEKKTKKGEPKKRKGNYIQRMLADEHRVPEFKELLKGDEEYTQHDLKLAEKRSNQFIKDFQKQFGEKEGLLITAKILKSDKKSEGFPEIMMGPISSKLETLMEKMGMREEALSIIKFKQEEARKAGRLLVGIREDASPDEVVSLMRDRIREDKIDKINEEFKEGKNYNQALKEMQTRLNEVEAAYKKLKETGKIDESFLPKQKPKAKKARISKSKALREEGEVLIKKGADNLSAYFKSQRGGLSMGLKIDDKLITALGQILKGYALKFEGDILGIYEVFKKDILEQYPEISDKDIDGIKDRLIDDFNKNKKKLQIINEILKPDKKETTKEVAARKEASENILNDINENKSIEEVSDNLSDLANFKKIDPKVLEDILQLAVEYGDLLNEGKLELASSKFDNLMDMLYELGLKNRSINEVVMDLWYTAVLSGLTTVRRSLYGSGITATMSMINRFISTPMSGIMFRELIKGFKGARQNYIHVLKTGKSNVQIIDSKSPIRPYTSALFDRKLGTVENKGVLGKAKAVPKDAWKLFQMGAIGMFRNIVAWDQVLKNATSEANYALYVFENTDKGKTKKQRIKDTEKALQNDKNQEIEEMVAAEIEKLKRDGKKIATGYKYRRFKEIKNTFRDAEFLKKAMDDAAEFAMVGSPKGILGRFYKGIVGKSEIKEGDQPSMIAAKVMFKVFFPFFRIGFNFINMGLDYTPVGLKRGLSKTRWTKDGTQDLTSFEKREFLVKATEGALLTMGLMLSQFDFDDWEEDGIKLKPEKDSYFIVNGPLTGEWDEEDQTSKGSEPWSVRYRTDLKDDFSSPIKYMDNPIGFVFAPIGIMRDELYFNKLDENPDEKQRKTKYIMSMIASGTLQYALDKSFNQGVNSVSKIWGAMGSGDIDKLETEVIKATIRPVKGMSPGLYNQMYAQYNAAAGVPEKEHIRWYENLSAKNIFVNHLIANDKVDVFGYPLVKNFDVPFFPDFILKWATETLDYRETLKPWKLLHKYEDVVVGRFKAPPKNIYGDRFTEQEKYDYKKEAGLNFRKLVEDAYAILNTYDKKTLQTTLDIYKGIASTQAKYKISQKKQ